MRNVLIAAASLSLLATPFAAEAQSHHAASAFSGHGGGVAHSQAAPAFRGGGFAGRTGGFRGGYGYRGYGYRGYGYPGYGYALGGLGLGLVAGAALADSYYPGYYAPYGYDYDDYGYAPGQACGQWIWAPNQGRYIWSAAPC